VLYLLTFIACLSGAPDRPCQPVEIAWEGSVFHCMAFGQIEMVRWVAEHPGFYVRAGYRCVPGRAA